MLKIKDGFMLREIAGTMVVVPLGERVIEFNGLMSLSESGALLWRKLEQGAEIDELVDLILSEYDIDRDTARADIEEFIAALKEKGLLNS